LTTSGVLIILVFNLLNSRCSLSESSGFSEAIFNILLKCDIAFCLSIKGRGRSSISSKGVALNY